VPAADVRKVAGSHKRRGRGVSTFPSTVRTDYIPKIRFSATPGEEREIEVALVLRPGASALLIDLSENRLEVRRSDPQSGEGGGL
jgi:hypothetical protein